MKAHRPKTELEKMLETPFCFKPNDSDFVLKFDFSNASEDEDIVLSWSFNEDMSDAHEVSRSSSDAEKQVASSSKPIYVFCTRDNPSFGNSIGQNFKFTCVGRYSIGGNMCFLSHSSCFKRTDYRPAGNGAGYQFLELFDYEPVIDAEKCVCGYSSIDGYDLAYMFQNCLLLKTGPLLLTEHADFWCYECMFYGCSQLESAKVYATTFGEADPLYKMFDGCTSMSSIHYSRQADASQLLAMPGGPTFGADNATVCYDL